MNLFFCVGGELERSFDLWLGVGEVGMEKMCFIYVSG